MSHLKLRNKLLVLTLLLGIFVVSLVSAGYAAYTYNINHNGYSQYNVIGTINYTYNFSHFQFQTYSAHIGGLQRYLDQLLVRGRVWQAQTLSNSTTPICVRVSDTPSGGYLGCSACNAT